MGENQSQSAAKRRMLGLSLPRMRFRLSSLLWVMLLSAILFGWWRDRQYLLDKAYGFDKSEPNWQPHQATGPPDTAAMGDYQTAWASATSDGQKEWLALEYRKAVRPNSIVIYETYNPGAVYRITAFNFMGTEQTIWEGVDPAVTQGKVAVSKIPVRVPFKTRKIKLYIDSPAVAGWNEIDAVAIKDNRGRTQWAKRATASSTYAAHFNTYVRLTKPRQTFWLNIAR